MTQNERVLADVYETFRHNPQEQYDVDQLENDLSRSQRLNFPDLVKALTFLEHSKKIVTDGQGKYQLNQIGRASCRERV